MNSALAEIIPNIANWYGDDVVDDKTQIVQIEFTGTNGKWYSFEYYEIWTSWGDGEDECEGTGWIIYQDGINIKEVQDRTVLYWLGACAGTDPADIKITTYAQKPSTIEKSW